MKQKSSVPSIGMKNMEPSHPSVIGRQNVMAHHSINDGEYTPSKDQSVRGAGGKNQMTHSRTEPNLSNIPQVSQGIVQRIAQNQ